MNAFHTLALSLLKSNSYTVKCQVDNRVIEQLAQPSTRPTSYSTLTTKKCIGAFYMHNVYNYSYRSIIPLFQRHINSSVLNYYARKESAQ